MIFVTALAAAPSTRLSCVIHSRSAVQTAQMDGVPNGSAPGAARPCWPVCSPSAGRSRLRASPPGPLTAWREYAVPPSRALRPAAVPADQHGEADPTFRAASLGTARIFANAVVCGPGMGASQPIEP